MELINAEKLLWVSIIACPILLLALQHQVWLLVFRNKSYPDCLNY